MKNCVILFTFLSFITTSFSQDSQKSTQSIDKLFISTSKINMRINNGTSYVGKSGYIYFNSNYVVIYLEDSKKPPSVYKIKYWNKYIDSLQQTITFSFVHFDYIEDENKFFLIYQNKYNDPYPIPQETITFTIPYGGNKSKYKCGISYHTQDETGLAHEPYVEFEGKTSTHRYAEMEIIIEAALAKEKILNKNRLKIGDEYYGGIIVYTDKSGQHGFICTKTDIANSISYNEAIAIADTFRLSNRKWRLPKSFETDYISRLKIAKLGLMKVSEFNSLNYWIFNNSVKGIAAAYAMGKDGGMETFWGADYKGYKADKGDKSNFSSDVGLRLVSTF